MSKLLIVESPSKAKKIGALLGAGWMVKATVGHFRDLPKRSLAVSRPSYGIDYEISEGKEDVVNGLRSAVKAADHVYLGTDPDREGEAIAWHLEQVLGLTNPDRVEFHEITAAAITSAIAMPRKIDYALVRAQEARRALDRLVGYEVSSALRDKTQRPLTAGRVQTVGLRLVVDREEEIGAHVLVKHFGVELRFDSEAERWSADWKPALAEGQKYFLDCAFVDRVAAIRNVRVTACDEKTTKKAPPAPFTTSTLQQAGSNRLKLPVERVMEIAQSLFEKGLISYHRTDSPNIADETFAAIVAFAEANSIPTVPTKRSWKAKDSSQGAHEAIRPTSIELRDARTHAQLDHRATDEEQRVYEMIWSRTIASQMPDAEFAVRAVSLVSIDLIDGKPMDFLARGITLVVPGFKALGDDATEDAKDDPEAKNRVPAIAIGEQRTATDGKVISKKTNPPDRYTEASLVKALEDRGVGRPSTYASIVKLIQTRNYVDLCDRKFKPTPSGTDLIGLVRDRFGFAEIRYTAELEDHLDAVAGGAEQYIDVMRDADQILQREISAFGGAAIVGCEAQLDGGVCPACNTANLARRRRKSGDGFFWSCSSYPTCTFATNDVEGKPNLVPREPRIEGGQCPTCKKQPLIRRTNDRGVWWGCAGFKDGCKASYPDLDGKPNLDVAARPPMILGPKCPVCKKEKLRKLTGASGVFWGCSGFRAGCKATFPDVDGKPNLKYKRAS